MRLYFAPMEGITGAIFRRVHHEIYSGIDKYYAPFLTPGPEKGISAKGLRDVLPENNEGIPLVPQILTNRAEDFKKTARLLGEHGYREVNLNLGCPSGTVVSKKKGAGFLAFPEELQAFLEEIFADEPMVRGEIEISVKTRCGKDSSEEWPRLLEIYNQYPIRELILHPRVQTDMYKNRPNLEVVERTVAEGTNPLVYNGDLFSEEEFQRFSSRFPRIDTVMIGRGFLRNPGLAEELKNGAGFQKEKMKRFHDRLLEEYSAAMSGDRNVLFKMKELWFYMIDSFPEAGKLEKRIKKASRLAEYRDVVEEVFAGR